MVEKNIPFIVYNLDKQRTFKLNMEAEFKLDELGINIFAFVYSIPLMKNTMDIPIIKVCKILSACSVDNLTPQKIYKLIEEYSNYLESIQIIEKFAINGLVKLGGEDFANKVMEDTSDPNVIGE